jgi:hypothetical protein
VDVVLADDDVGAALVPESGLLHLVDFVEAEVDAVEVGEPTRPPVDGACQLHPIAGPVVDGVVQHPEVIDVRLDLDAMAVLVTVDGPVSGVEDGAVVDPAERRPGAGREPRDVHTPGVIPVPLVDTVTIPAVMADVCGGDIRLCTDPKAPTIGIELVDVDAVHDDVARRDSEVSVPTQLDLRVGDATGDEPTRLRLGSGPPQRGVTGE